MRKDRFLGRFVACLEDYLHQLDVPTSFFPRKVRQVAAERLSNSDIDTSESSTPETWVKRAKIAIAKWLPFRDALTRKASNGSVGFDVAQRLNTSWARSRRGSRITVQRKPIIDARTKIFALGSCFAREIRVALRARGYDVYPKYFDLKFDPSRQQPNMLPRFDNINHYDTFVIRQEIERAITRQTYSPKDFWQLKNHPLAAWPQACTDPYRRKIYAADMDSLIDLSARLGECIADGLASADVAIITLGLTECWRNKLNGLFVCEGPKSPRDERFSLVEFFPSTYADNYANLAAIIDQLGAAYPKLQIVLTVSPVALHRTAMSEDVVVANMTSKTTLRAVAGEICRQYPNVIYWPSYEYALTQDVFEADGRHVAPHYVNRIVTSFLSAHSEDPRS